MNVCLKRGCNNPAKVKFCSQRCRQNHHNETNPGPWSDQVIKNAQVEAYGLKPRYSPVHLQDMTPEQIERELLRR